MGSVLAELVVKVSGDTASLTSALGRAEKSMGGLHGTASKLGSAMGTALKVGALGAVAGIGAVAYALKGFVGDAMEAQKITTQTNAVLESTKGVSGMTAQSVEALANSLSKVIPVDDELIQSTENMLLTFTSVGKDIFPQATEAALNMATALGGDPVDAALKLGKALNDPVAGVTALRKVGVMLTDQQKEQIKGFMAVNDIASAQAVILKELETEFGNSGRAAGETAAGQFKILGTQIGNVKEAIGKGLLPILTSAAKALTAFVSDHQEDIERFTQDVSDWLGVKIPEAVNAIKRALEKAQPYIEDLKAIFQKLSPYWSEIKRGIEGFIAVMIVATVIKFASAVGTMATNFLLWPGKVIGKAITDIRNFVSAAAGLVSKTVTITQNVVTSGAEIIRSLPFVAQEITQLAKRTLVDPTKDWITDFSTKTQEITQLVTSKVTVPVEKAAVGTSLGIKFAQGMAQAFGAVIGGLLVAAFVAAYATVGWEITLAALAVVIGIALVSTLAVVFRDKLGPFFGETLPRLFTEALPQFVKSLPGWAGTVAGFVAGALVLALLGIPALLITRVAPAIGNAIGGLFEKIPLDKIGGAFAAIPGLLGDALGAIPGLLAIAGIDIQKFALNVPGWIANAFVSLPDLLAEAGGQFLTFATNVPDWIADAFGKIPGIATAALTGAGGLVGVVTGAMGDVFSAIWNAGLDRAVTWAMDQVKEGFKTGWKAVDDLTNGALTDLVTGATDILGGIWDAFDGLLDPIQWVIDRVYQLIEAIGRIPTPGDFLGGVKSGVEKIWPFASGGITPGGMAVVGEKGPELVNLPGGSRVYSNAESRQMVGGVTNNVEIHMNVTASGEEVESKVFRALDRALRSAGFGGSLVTSGAFTPV